MGYNLLINDVYWVYNPLTNLLLTSWDFQVARNSASMVARNSLIGQGGTQKQAINGVK